MWLIGHIIMAWMAIFGLAVVAGARIEPLERLLAFCTIHFGAVVAPIIIHANAIAEHQDISRKNSPSEVNAASAPLLM